MPPLVPPDILRMFDPIMSLFFKVMGVAVAGFIGFCLFVLVAAVISKVLKMEEETCSKAVVVFGVIGILAGAISTVYLLFF